MIQYINDHHNRYICLAVVALKKTIPPDIRRDLVQRNLHEDLEQEIAIIAYEGMQNYCEDDKEYLNFAGRRLYHFLRQNGYRRPKGHKSYVRENIGLNNKNI